VGCFHSTICSLIASLKQEAEKLTTSLREILGNAEFNHLYAEVNDYYHRKRNDNRAKKKEKVPLLNYCPTCLVSFKHSKI